MWNPRGSEFRSQHAHICMKIKGRGEEKGEGKRRMEKSHTRRRNDFSRSESGGVCVWGGWWSGLQHECKTHNTDPLSSPADPRQPSKS